MIWFDIYYDNNLLNSELYKSFKYIRLLIAYNMSRYMRKFNSNWSIQGRSKIVLPTSNKKKQFK